PGRNPQEDDSGPRQPVAQLVDGRSPLDAGCPQRGIRLPPVVPDDSEALFHRLEGDAAADPAEPDDPEFAYRAGHSPPIDYVSVTKRALDGSDTARVPDLPTPPGGE